MTRKLLTRISELPTDPGFEVWEEPDGSVSIWGGDKQALMCQTSPSGGLGSSAAGPVLSGPVPVWVGQELLSPARHSPGQVVCNFNTAHKLASQVSAALADTPAEYPGYKPSSAPKSTMLTTLGTANAYSVHEITAGAAACMDAPGGSLILWINIPDRAALCTGGITVEVEMWAGTGSSPDATVLDSVGSPGPWVSGLSRVVIDKSQLVPGGASPAAWKDITRCRIQVKKASTPTLLPGSQYELVALTFGQRCRRPKVAFTFDKSNVSQIPGMQYLAANGIPFATSLIASQLGQPNGSDMIMNAAQLAEIAATTQSLVIPHTVNTVTGSGSDAAALSQLLGNIASIEAVGLPNFDKRFVKYASGSYSFSGLDDGLAAMLRDSGWCQAALISSGGGQVGPWWRDRFYARRQIFQGPTADPAVEAAAIQKDLIAGRSRIISSHNFSADGAGASEITIAKYRALVDSVVGFARGGLCDIVWLPEYVAALE